jgi:hypothetical protein
MAKKEYHKCGKEKGFCPTLEKFTQPGDGKAKGLSYFTVLDIDTLKILTLGIVYREKAGANGIMLNYCPFCGEDLRPFRKDHCKQEQAN